MIFLGLVYLLLAAYTLLILGISAGWFLTRNTVKHNGIPKTQVSILLPVRNEGENIENVLHDIDRQDYPPELIEVLVIDDHSDDDTIDKVRSLASSARFRIRLLQPESTDQIGKKAAILRGVRESVGKFILTTDADCRLGSQWVRSIVDFYEKHSPKMVLSPVKISGENRLWHHLQSLEWNSLMAVTAGSARSGNPLLASGANLAYEKEAFLECGGYSDNIAIPSGDDVFLMLAIRKKFGAGSVQFLKDTDATVKTIPQADLTTFLQQRLRWVSKSRGYTSVRMTIVSLLVYLTNLAFLVTSVAGICIPDMRETALWFFVLKMGVDFPVMVGVSGFFNQWKLLWLFPIMELFNSVYTVAIGFAGNLMTYRWKGRKFSPSGNS